MKTIIISNIREETESIIRYGLNFGKHTETKTDIFHLIDPKAMHGPYSSYSDSQTTTPGEKLSHEEVMKREKEMADNDFKKILSREVSRLNYPLRVNTEIEIKEMEPALKEAQKEDPNSLLVSGTIPGSHMVSGLDELLKMARNAGLLSWIVPPNQEFVKPEKAILIVEPEEGKSPNARNLFEWLNLFPTLVHALTLAHKDTQADTQENTIKWMEDIKSYSGSGLDYNTGVLKGDDLTGRLLDHIRKSKPDLVILPNGKKSKTGNYFYSAKEAGQMVEAFDKPVLFY